MFIICKMKCVFKMIKLPWYWEIVKWRNEHRMVIKDVQVTGTSKLFWLLDHSSVQPLVNGFDSEYEGVKIWAKVGGYLQTSFEYQSSSICRCRWINGDLPFHDWCLWSEVPWRVQPACTGMDGQHSVSGHWVFGDAVHRGIGPPPHISHSGEIHLHRLPFPVLDSWLAKNCLYTFWDLGVRIRHCFFAADLQGAFPQLLWDQWSLFSPAFWAARDTLGLCVLHCNFSGWGFTKILSVLIFFISFLYFKYITTQPNYSLVPFTLICICLHWCVHIFQINDCQIGIKTIIIFLSAGLNLVAFLIIVFSYASMFYNIQRTGTQTTKYSNHIKKEVTIAKRFFSIVITDSLCWIPIFILKILSLLHVEIPGTVEGTMPSLSL